MQIFIDLKGIKLYRMVGAKLMLVKKDAKLKLI